MFFLTKRSIFDWEAWRGNSSIYGEYVIAALATEDRGVTPASAKEQQHHEHHHSESGNSTYVCRSLHCTTQNNEYTQREHNVSNATCLPLVGFILPALATILSYRYIAGQHSRYDVDLCVS